jgi:hypothetical protein
MIRLESHVKGKMRQNVSRWSSHDMRVSVSCKRVSNFCESLPQRNCKSVTRCLEDNLFSSRFRFLNSFSLLHNSFSHSFTHLSWQSSLQLSWLDTHLNLSRENIPSRRPYYRGGWKEKLQAWRTWQLRYNGTCSCFHVEWSTGFKQTLMISWVTHC